MWFVRSTFAHTKHSREEGWGEEEGGREGGEREGACWTIQNDVSWNRGCGKHGGGTRAIVRKVRSIAPREARLCGYVGMFRSPDARQVGIDLSNSVPSRDRRIVDRRFGAATARTFLWAIVESPVCVSVACWQCSTSATASQTPRAKWISRLADILQQSGSVGSAKCHLSEACILRKNDVKSLYTFFFSLFFLFFFLRSSRRRYSKDEIRFVALVSITEASHRARFAVCSLYWHVGAIFEASASRQKFGILPSTISLSPNNLSIISLVISWNSHTISALVRFDVYIQGVSKLRWQTPLRIHWIVRNHSFLSVYIVEILITFLLWLDMNNPSRVVSLEDTDELLKVTLCNVASEESVRNLTFDWIFAWKNSTHGKNS